MLIFIRLVFFYGYRDFNRQNNQIIDTGASFMRI